MNEDYGTPVVSLQANDTDVSSVGGQLDYLTSLILRPLDYGKVWRSKNNLFHYVTGCKGLA